MSCVCKQELEATVQAWCDLPLPALSAKVPSFGLAGIQQASFGLLAAAGAAGGAGAQAQAMAQASASASATAEAQALLGAYAALGLDPFAADASAHMSLAIDSMNAHLPWALGQLTAAFDAHFSALATLNACLSASLVVEALFDFSLTELGAGAKLEAALAASAQGHASAQASALASANASAQLAATASGLGFDLSAPGAQADFAAALSAAGSFGAALALPIGSLGLAASAVAQIRALASIGIDLFAPDAELAIGLKLPALFAGVEALLGLDLAAAAAAQAEAQAAATGTAGASADLNADLGLPELGAFGSLSLAASLQAALALDGSLALPSPCGVCPLKVQLVA